MTESGQWMLAKYRTIETIADFANLPSAISTEATGRLVQKFLFI